MEPRSICAMRLGLPPPTGTAKIVVASVYPIEDQRRVIDGTDGYFDKSEGFDILLSRIKRVLTT